MAAPQKPKNMVCLWYDKDAEDAARFYAETFPDSAVKEVFRAPTDFPSGKAGDVLTVTFTEPNVAAVGLTLDAALEKGIKARAVDVDSNGSAGASFYGKDVEGTSRLVIDTDTDCKESN